MSTGSPYWVSLTEAEAAFQSDLGSIRVVDGQNLPILSRLSIKRVVLAPGAIREPQWNVNANQLAYVVSGEVLVSLLASGGEFASFVVGEGQMYHVESGAVYHIENLGSADAEIIIALRNERPQHFSLRDSLSAMTNPVLGNTYDLPSTAFVAFERAPAEQIFARRGSITVDPTQKLPNARLFDVQGQRAPLSYAYGSANLARKQFWAALDDISMYSLQIKEDGMREPHWHPVTAEMGYVAKGRARMRVLAPDVTLGEYELGPGDVYFVPRAYPHHIEVLDEGGFHFLIFFDQPTPGDVGYRATATAFSREVLAGTFGISERELPQFPFTAQDPLIVARHNPVGATE
ncbi:cupin domain-containing protein [Streptomyces sp. KM273126]|uniref:cupin domain-containing protein n=1 Tax=Streptomyces sp. KM273126 TaxID=2545247 RepID=UPI0010386CE4|nr:cupin domain-containing protein [Streptomyces sp. KM273126]MBA2810267.1 cupin domain-containing protein [Streptomyces sp. KM273126]